MTAASRTNLSFATNLPGAQVSQIMLLQRHSGYRFLSTKTRFIFNGSRGGAGHVTIAAMVNCPICPKIAAAAIGRRHISNKTSLETLLFHVGYEAAGNIPGWTECRIHIYMWVRRRPVSELLRVERA